MKTICIYHSRDLDGWMSAAIVKKWFEENNKNPHFVELKNIHAVNLEAFGENILSFLGWDYGDEIPNLLAYDRVIMVDVSFPKDEMWKLYKQVGTNLIWIDHHISAINDIGIGKGDILGVNLAGLRNSKFAACELTWMYFFGSTMKDFTNVQEIETMPEIVRLLGRYDCFGHKGTDEEQQVLEFQYGARACIDDYEEAYKCLIDSINFIYSKENRVSDTIESLMLRDGKAIYEYLCVEAKQTYSKAFPILFYTPTGKGEIPRQFLCVNQERFNPINFGIDYHKEGYDGFACFWLKDGKWNWSLYNDNGEVDCSVIAKQYGGGGHKGASGFVQNWEELFRLIRF